MLHLLSASGTPRIKTKLVTRKTIDTRHAEYNGESTSQRYSNNKMMFTRFFAIDAVVGFQQLSAFRI